MFNHKYSCYVYSLIDHLQRKISSIFGCKTYILIDYLYYSKVLTAHENIALHNCINTGQIINAIISPELLECFKRLWNFLWKKFSCLRDSKSYKQTFYDRTVVHVTLVGQRFSVNYLLASTVSDVCEHINYLHEIWNEIEWLISAANKTTFR